MVNGQKDGRAAGGKDDHNKNQKWISPTLQAEPDSICDVVEGILAKHEDKQQDTKRPHLNLRAQLLIIFFCEANKSHSRLNTLSGRNGRMVEAIGAVPGSNPSHPPLHQTSVTTEARYRTCRSTENILFRASSNPFSLFVHSFLHKLTLFLFKMQSTFSKYTVPVHNLLYLFTTYFTYS